MDDVGDGARFKEDLEADSLDMAELVLALEDQFSVSLPEEEVARLKTVGEALVYLSDLLQRQ